VTQHDAVLTRTTMIMPELGEAVAEGVVARWLKQEGQVVELDEPLLEVITDKVNAEVPAALGGRLVRILAQEGQTVPVGAPLAEFEQVSPGPQDAAAPATQGQSAPVERVTVVAPASAAAIAGASAPSGAGDRLVPLSPMARLTAEHMVLGVRTAPHTIAVAEADLGAVMGWLAANGTDFQRREGLRPTPLAFILHALCQTLVEFPLLNSSWRDDALVLHSEVNLGVAVALQEGMAVPVLPQAGALTLLDLAHALADLMARAQENRLEMRDIQGGTFTVSETGAFGVLLGNAVIMQPQVAVLSIGAITRRPVVLADDTIAPRWRAYLTLTFDHRVADGMTAGRFLSALGARLETMAPDTLI